MGFALLNDEPVTESASDLLGTGRAARQLARMLHDSRGSTPFTPNGELRSRGPGAEITMHSSDLYKYIDSVLTPDLRAPDSATSHELA